MHQRITKIIIIIATGIIFMACTKSMDSKCITVNAQQYGGEPIIIKTNGCVTVEFESQLSTGYRWQFSVKENPGVLVHSDYKVHTAEGQVVGGVDKELFTFMAVKAGNASIVFDYVRPFEKKPKPVKSRELFFTIME